MSHHADQVASVIRRAVQDILSRGLNDPRVRGLVSVTRVKLSPDLAEAAIGVSVLPEEHADLAFKGICHATPHIQAEVGRRVALRRVPRIRFTLDRTLKNQAETLAAINRGRRRDAADRLTDSAEDET